MIALILAVLVVLAFAVFAIRRVAACPLLRTLAISANCWAEGARHRKEVA